MSPSRIAKHITFMVAAIGLAGACLMPALPSKADEYPPCTRGNRFPWPDKCIVGGYRHWGDIYDSHVIHRSGPVYELPRGEEVKEIAFPLEDYFERARTTGLIVLKDGKIVFERYRLGADERS